VSFALIVVMGPLLIVWPVWLGVELLRSRPMAAAALGVTTDFVNVARGSAT
jgi:hypothetical protein